MRLKPLTAVRLKIKAISIRAFADRQMFLRGLQPQTKLHLLFLAGLTSNCLAFLAIGFYIRLAAEAELHKCRF